MRQSISSPKFDIPSPVKNKHYPLKFKQYFQNNFFFFWGTGDLGDKTYHLSDIAIALNGVAIFSGAVSQTEIIDLQDCGAEWTGKLKICFLFLLNMMSLFMERWSLVCLQNIFENTTGQKFIFICPHPGKSPWADNFTNLEFWSEIFSFTSKLPPPPEGRPLFVFPKPWRRPNLGGVFLDFFQKIYCKTFLRFFLNFFEFFVFFVNFLQPIFVKMGGGSSKPWWRLNYVVKSGPSLGPSRNEPPEVCLLWKKVCRRSEGGGRRSKGAVCSGRFGGWRSGGLVCSGRSALVDMWRSVGGIFFGR